MTYRKAAPLALLTCLPWVAGCETSPKDRLQGRWVGDRVENFAEAQLGRATGWARGTSFEFRGNRVTVSIPAESPRQGTYQITRSATDSLRVSFLRPNGARDDVEFRLEGEDVLRWVLAEGRAVVFRRVRD